MSITINSNINFINQNQAMPSAAYASATALNSANITEFENKIKKIEEVKKTEELEAINKDGRNGGGSSGNDKNKKEDTSEEKIGAIITDDELSSPTTTHKIDFLV